MDLTISLVDFILLFQKWKESKSVSPYEWHVGHFKAIMEEDQSIQYNCIICYLQVKYRCAPERGTTTVKVMLEKDLRKLRLDPLQVIHLLEADNNIALKLIWGRPIMRRAAQFRYLMPLQQERPGYLTINAVLNKRLAYNLLRLIKVCEANFNNDAAGCYGNIDPPHRILYCKQLGLPKNAAKILTIILNNTT